MFSSIRKPTRLGQWDGRRRSSRNEEPVLSRLWHAAVLLRLATVLATMAGVTFMAFRSGPPLSYRVGEICATDLRVRAPFEMINQPQTDLAHVAVLKRMPTEQISDAAARERIIRTIPPVVDKYSVGKPLVRRGEPIKEAELALLKEEHRAYLRSLTPTDHARRGMAP